MCSGGRGQEEGGGGERMVVGGGGSGGGVDLQGDSCTCRGSVEAEEKVRR